MDSVGRELRRLQQDRRRSDGRQPTPSPPATSALPAAWTITSRPTRWPASRSLAAAPTGDWRKVSAVAGATPSRRRLRQDPIRPLVSRRRARLRRSPVHHQPHRVRRSTHRQLQRPELWRPRRDRLPLCGAAADRPHALRRRAGAELPHAELQRRPMSPPAVSG